MDRQIWPVFTLLGVLDARDNQNLYYWMECPANKDDPEWYEPHWHPISDHPLLIDSSTNLRKLADLLADEKFGVEINYGR